MSPGKTPVENGEDDNRRLHDRTDLHCRETERAFMLQTLRIFSSISTGFLLLFSDFQKRDNRSVHLSTQGR